VVKVKKEDVSPSESEYERDQTPDNIEDLAERNHDPCEDGEEFEFDKTELISPLGTLLESL
jgi:hypothetical protein